MEAGVKVAGCCAVPCKLYNSWVLNLVLHVFLSCNLICWVLRVHLQVPESAAKEEKKILYCTSVVHVK